MPSPAHASRSLPENPDLRHLKQQARNLLDAGVAASVTDAQFQLARQYGFASWPRLRDHVEPGSGAVLNPLETGQTLRDLRPRQRPGAERVPRRQSDLVGLLLKRGARTDVTASIRKPVDRDGRVDHVEYRNVTPAAYARAFAETDLVNEGALEAVA